MDRKTIFTVTLSGEGEIKSHTSHLSGDIKRALLLVDDVSTVAELLKRAAPSLRTSLDEMLQELLDGGFIQEKGKQGNAPRIAIPRIATPVRKVEEDGMDLDFTIVNRPPGVTAAAGAAKAGDQAQAEQARMAAEIAAEIKVRAEAQARQDAELERIRVEKDAAIARVRAEMEARAKQEAEAARIKAEQETVRLRAEAEATRIRVEQDAARAKADAETARVEMEQVRTKLAEARASAEARARADALAQQAAQQAAEAARIKTEQEAARLRAEAEATRVRVEQDAARAKADAEAARLRAEQDAAQAKAEAEAARREAERARMQLAENMARTQAEEQARQEAQLARLKIEQQRADIKEQQARQAAADKPDSAAARSKITSVLFLELVGYSTLSAPDQTELKASFNRILSECVKGIEQSTRIVVDMGEGAAIGFLQSPGNAIEVALRMRHALAARPQDALPLKVRMGINIGPVSVVQQTDGQSSMAGEGINIAQLIMRFALAGSIYISRPYYDAILRQSAKHAKLLKYRGREQDERGRQHQIYEVLDEQAADSEQPVVQQKSTPYAFQLDSFLLKDAEQDQPEAAQASAASSHSDALPASAAAAGDSAVERQPLEEVAQQRAGNEAEARPARLSSPQDTAKLQAAAAQMAAEQARLWAEAEQRAKEQAAAQELAGAQAQADLAAARPPAPVARQVATMRRKPVPWGKIAASMLLLLLALAALLPYVLPMQDYVAQLEKKLSAQLQQPVHISQMKAALLPVPKLELRDVTVGGAQELKAASVVLNFSLPALFTESRLIDSMDINDLVLHAASFSETVSWLRAAGGDAHYPVAHMTLHRARVEGAGLPVVNGSADWDEQRHFYKAVLNSEDGKLGVLLQRQNSHWQVAVNIKESSLPALPELMFHEFSAKGEVSEGVANFTELTGNLYGAILAGNAQLNWQNGWQMQGRVTIKMLELHDVFPQFGIAGELAGDSTFLLRAATLPQLAHMPHLDGSFAVKKGVINKIDIVRTASEAGRPGGRTNFDELSGVLQLDSNNLRLSQVKIAAGVMSASGAVDVSPERVLSGRLNVDLKMRAGLGSVPLVLSGTLTDPVLGVAR